MVLICRHRSTGQRARAADGRRFCEREHVFFFFPQSDRGRSERARKKKSFSVEERNSLFPFSRASALNPLPLQSDPPPPLDRKKKSNPMGLFGTSSSSSRRSSLLALFFLASACAVSAEFPDGFSCKETKDGITGSAARYISVKPGVKDKVTFVFWMSKKGARAP